MYLHPSLYRCLTLECLIQVRKPLVFEEADENKPPYQVIEADNLKEAYSKLQKVEFDMLKESQRLWPLVPNTELARQLDQINFILRLADAGIHTKEQLIQLLWKKAQTAQTTLALAKKLFPKNPSPELAENAIYEILMNQTKAVPGHSLTPSRGRGRHTKWKAYTQEEHLAIVEQKEFEAEQEAMQASLIEDLKNAVFVTGGTINKSNMTVTFTFEETLKLADILAGRAPSKDWHEVVELLRTHAKFGTEHPRNEFDRGRAAGFEGAANVIEFTFGEKKDV